MDDWGEVGKHAGRAALIGAGVSGAVGIIQQRYGTVGAWCRGILSGALVSMFAILAIHDSTLPIAMQAFIAGALAVVAQDLIDATVQVGALIRKDPIGLVRMIIAALRGRK